jgi:hypothetical protein
MDFTQTLNFFLKTTEKPLKIADPADPTKIGQRDDA